jgi:hypothetical protein
MMDGEPRRGGRPRKSEGPRVPYEELDRILVFGEVVPCEDGNGTTVVYPSYRELAERYGVSNSVIAEYAKTHNVQRRRREAQARIQAKAENKLVEMRATAIALSKDDELRIIDGYLSGFEKALGEGRVRFDNPADFNTMVRLKEFVMGNADSRQEIHAALSLESLQARHRQVMRVADASPAERGEVDRAALPSAGVEDALDPPARPTKGADQEPPARIPGRFDESERAAAVLGSRPDLAPTRADVGASASAPEEGPMRARRRDVLADGGAGSTAPASSARVPAPGGQETVPDSSSTPSSTSMEELTAFPRSARPDGALSAVVAEHAPGDVRELTADDALADTMRPGELARTEAECE